MTHSPTYDADAILLLAEKIKYEGKLLEEVYPLDPKPYSSSSYPVVYLVDGSEPKFVNYVEGAGNLFGDWRSGFLADGTPLVLVVTFKLLDMFIEWVLKMNRIEPEFGFTGKIKQLKKSNPTFPRFIEERPWLKERILGLYKTLAPYRSVIIHRPDFQIDGNGFLQITDYDLKNGSFISEIEINPTELQQFSLTIVSVVRYVSGDWHIDPYQEKVLRHNLDNLVNFHGITPALGQRQPLYTKVRLFSQDTDIQHIDTFKIYEDVAKHYPDRDCMFDLQVLIVREGVAVDAFFFPCTDLEKGYPEWSNNINIDDFRVKIPDNIDFL